MAAHYDLPSEHGLSLLEDDLGFDVAECDCGWMSQPCPDSATAAECYALHVLAAVS